MLNYGNYSLAPLLSLVTQSRQLNLEGLFSVSFYFTLRHAIKLVRGNYNGAHNAEMLFRIIVLLKGFLLKSTLWTFSTVKNYYCKILRDFLAMAVRYYTSKVFLQNLLNQPLRLLTN